MEAKQLELGDWVKTQPGGIQRVLGLEEGHVVVKGISVVEDCVEPILLTKEILEKNGFRKQKYGYFSYKDYNERVDVMIGLGYTEISYIRYIFNPEDVTEVDFDCELNIKDCKVHELQHALKLFGIDKDIIL